MAKYSQDLDENLVKIVKNISHQYGLDETEVNVEAIRLTKIGKSVGEIVKGNDLVKMFTNKDVIGVALYEEAFLSVDQPTQEIWIEGLISQISYDYEKEKIKITKPELNISMGMYNKYGKVLLEKEVLAQLTLEQLKEKEQEAKEQEKYEKKQKKNKDA